MTPVEEVLHELAASVSYDEEAAIPYAVLARVASMRGYVLDPPPDPYCPLCQTTNCGNNCDREYERSADK